MRHWLEKSKRGSPMSKNDLQSAVSQRRPAMPPIRRGEGIKTSVDEEQERKPTIPQPSNIAPIQNSNTALSQNRKIAKDDDRKEVRTQQENNAESDNSEISDEQLRYLAKILHRVTEDEQKKEKAKQQKEDLAETLVQALAKTDHQEFRNLAESQRRKITQGVTAPEAIFVIYKVCANQLTMKGKKSTMGDLMTRGLIKYLVEEILPELGS